MGPEEVHVRGRGPEKGSLGPGDRLLGEGRLEDLGTPTDTSL
jgi:hypothetical protein